MSTFTKSIAEMWPDHIITPGTVHNCSSCTGGSFVSEDDEEALQMHDEGSFSWSPCESCGSGLGGDRYSAHAIHKEAFGPNAKRPNDVTHIDICVDCLVFHANGDEPGSWGDEDV